MHATLHHNGQTTQIASVDWLNQIESLGARGVIFDCDGTLVDSAAAHTQYFQAATRDQGFELTAQWYAPRNGLDRKTLLQHFKRDIATDLCVKYAIEFSIATFETYVGSVSPIPATTDLFKQLCEHGFRLAVVTNAERQIATRSLHHIGLLEHLQELVTISDGLPAKPAPHMFQHAAKVLDLRPSQVVVFEDSLQGVEAAISARMTVFEVCGI